MPKAAQVTRLALAAALAVAPLAGARAQSAVEQLLQQVLPGAGSQDSAGIAADAERACARYAEDRGLEVSRVLDARRAGDNDIEITLAVEDRDRRLEALCTYDTGDRQVRDLEERRATEARYDDRDDVDEELGRRARDACWEAAKRRDLDDIDFGQLRERDRDTVEVGLEARDRDGRRDLTCLYDDRERQAFLSE